MYDQYSSPEAAFNAYGHVAKWEDRVAERKAPGWFAILFKDNNEFYAVDFQFGVKGWWLSNDYIGPFESVREFRTEQLTLTLL